MSHTNSSILQKLRSLSPSRDCTFTEALQLAEHQAAALVRLLAARSAGFTVTGITTEHLAGMPRLRIVYEPLPVSGVSHWNGREWIICLNEDDSLPRQRFTLLHEYKHIIDHGRTPQLYTGTSRLSGEEQAERAADYFAGCALVPRTALKQAWGNRLQHPAILAEHFGVSEAAIQVRLDQTGLSRERDPEPDELKPRARCQRPIWTPRWQPQRFVTRRPHYGRSVA
ncbi:hypothetical protein GCM10027418_08600 [Mariniluteicoccus endophyticus]